MSRQTGATESRGKYDLLLLRDSLTRQRRQPTEPAQIYARLGLGNGYAPRRSVYRNSGPEVMAYRGKLSGTICRSGTCWRLRGRSGGKAVTLLSLLSAACNTLATQYSGPTGLAADALLALALYDIRESVMLGYMTGTEARAQALAALLDAYPQQRHMCRSLLAYVSSQPLWISKKVCSSWGAYVRAPGYAGPLSGCLRLWPSVISRSGLCSVGIGGVKVARA